MTFFVQCSRCKSSIVFNGNVTDSAGRDPNDPYVCDECKAAEHDTDATELTNPGSPRFSAMDQASETNLDSANDSDEELVITEDTAILLPDDVPSIDAWHAQQEQALQQPLIVFSLDDANDAKQIENEVPAHDAELGAEADHDAESPSSFEATSDGSDPTSEQSIGSLPNSHTDDDDTPLNDHGSSAKYSAETSDEFGATSTHVDQDITAEQDESPPGLTLDFESSDHEAPVPISYEPTAVQPIPFDPISSGSINLVEPPTTIQRLDDSASLHVIHPKEEDAESEELVLQSDTPADASTNDQDSAMDWNQVSKTVQSKPKKKESPLRVLSPLLGGLAALPVATLILWYGFGTDIGSLGPNVARYVPWIVPEKLRGKSQPPPIAFRPKSPNQKPATVNDTSSGYKNPFKSGSTSGNTPAPTNSDEPTTVSPSKSNVEPADKSSTKTDNAESTDKTDLETTKVVAPGNSSTASELAATLVHVKELQKRIGTWASLSEKEREDTLSDLVKTLDAMAEHSQRITDPKERVWKRELNTTCAALVRDNRFVGFIKLLWKGHSSLPAIQSGDWVAAVVDFESWDAADSAAVQFQLAEPLKLHGKPIDLRFQPNATTGLQIEPSTTTLLLGRVIQSGQDEPSYEVHFACPKTANTNRSTSK